MNEANKKSVWRFIQKHGDFLKDKLKPHPNHPKGRNPYAHIALSIKNRFKVSYKDIDDSKLEEVLNYIEALKKNPN